MSDFTTVKKWEVTPKKVDLVIQKIIEVSRPIKVILFGSYIQGKTNINSDVDIMVITGDDVKNPRKESVRIRRELREISMLMDILVVPGTQWNSLKNRPGLIYREAWIKGKVVYASN